MFYDVTKLSGGELIYGEPGKGESDNYIVIVAVPAGTLMPAVLVRVKVIGNDSH